MSLLPLHVRHCNTTIIQNENDGTMLSGYRQVAVVEDFFKILQRVPACWLEDICRGITFLHVVPTSHSLHPLATEYILPPPKKCGRAVCETLPHLQPTEATSNTTSIKTHRG